MKYYKWKDENNIAYYIWKVYDDNTWDIYKLCNGRVDLATWDELRETQDKEERPLWDGILALKEKTYIRITDEEAFLEIL